MADPICQVCGDSVSGVDRIECERCETPHHQDCWRYLGRCSTYACEGLVGVEIRSTADDFPAWVTALLPLPSSVTTPDAVRWVREGRVLALNSTRFPPGLGENERAMQIPVDVHDIPQESEETERTTEPSGVRQALIFGTVLAVAVAFDAVSTVLMAGGGALALLWVYLELHPPRPRTPQDRLPQRFESTTWYVHAPGHPLVERRQFLENGRLVLTNDTPICGGSPTSVRLTWRWGTALPSGSAAGRRPEYHLLLIRDGGSSATDLTTPLQVPLSNQSRLKFLERLRAMKMLGESVAETLGIPLEERWQHPGDVTGGADD